MNKAVALVHSIKRLVTVLHTKWRWIGHSHKTEQQFFLTPSTYYLRLSTVSLASRLGILFCWLFFFHPRKWKSSLFTHVTKRIDVKQPKMGCGWICLFLFYQIKSDHFAPIFFSIARNGGILCIFICLFFFPHVVVVLGYGCKRSYKNKITLNWHRHQICIEYLIIIIPI